MIFKCAIIIPAIDINDDVIKCVNECLSQNKVKVNIYLITNNKTKNIFKNSRVKCLNFGDVNMSVKRNKAVKICKENYIAFIDSDAYPTKNWLFNGIKILNKREDISVVTGPDLPFKNESGWKHIISLAHKSFLLSGSKVFRKKMGSQTFCNQASSCNMIIDKKIYKKVSGMDEKIYIGEDKDFCDRVNKFSKILYSPNVKIYHKTREFFPFIFQRFSYGTSIFDLIRNNKKIDFNNFQYFAPLLIMVFYIFLLLSLINNINLEISILVFYMINLLVFIESIKISLNPIKFLKIYTIIKLNILSFGLGSIMNFIHIKNIKKIYTFR